MVPLNVVNVAVTKREVATHWPIAAGATDAKTMIGAGVCPLNSSAPMSGAVPVPA